MNIEQNTRDLVCAITMQAVKDYLDGTDKERRTILKELRGSWMVFITNGTSAAVADRLEMDEGGIRSRMPRCQEEE